MDNEDALARFSVTKEELDAWEEAASQSVFQGEPHGKVVSAPGNSSERQA